MSADCTCYRLLSVTLKSLFSNDCRDIQSSVAFDMRQLCVLGVIFTILFAGGVNCDEIIREAVINEGSSYTVSVTTLLHNVRTCHLITPQNDKISFTPGDESQTTEKYYVEQGTPNFAECMLTIRNIDKNDEGLWVLSYDHNDGEGRIQKYNLTVNATETEESTATGDENAMFLSEINHFTRQEMLIDISLNKESYDEECYVRPPNGVLTKADLLKLVNVTVQSSSNYVSCRITIGPMSEELLGEWRLCGNSTIDNMRCQSAIIAWNNNNAIANWYSILQPRFNHSVHFGGSVNPGVAGQGDVLTCHVITPGGEDLVIKSDVKYPHIERVSPDSQSLCSIKFTDIDRPMLGGWAIYGKFRSVTLGLNEVRLPLNFTLYNEANPFEQAYNITVLPGGRRLVNLGTFVNMEVRSVGKVDNCLFRMPSGRLFDLNSTTTEDGVAFKNSIEPVCQLSIDPITEEMLGEWQLIGKFSNGNLFSEIQKTVNIIKEDPANPIIEDHRTVENLTELIVDSHMGASHRVTINSTDFVVNETCHILTPNGLQYAFIQGFNIPNVEIIEENGVECGVKVNVESLDMIGEWTLIARATRFSIPIERRLSFTIRVEETVSMGNPIYITEGSDLYLRLPNDTEFYDTCKLYRPNGRECQNFELDPIHQSSCGYIIRSVNAHQQGQWTIVYGNQITYNVTFEVIVLGAPEVSIPNLVWTLGSSINTSVGPDDTVYCKLDDVNSYTRFEGFGPCQIVVNRVTSDHRGHWTVFIGLPGTVLVQKHTFYVDVHGADSSPVVTTSVRRNAPIVLLTCSVPAEYEIQACKFRSPRGEILVASHGVGQDDYSFEKSIAINESDAHSHNCTLRLSNPTVQDLGLWRCGVVTEQGTYFNFLTVICPWLMQDSAVAASVVTEPVLKQDRDSYAVFENEPVQMSCSIDSAIRYCYFRDRNGTVYSVGPSTSSSDYEYLGSGLDAGDCGIRFSGLPAILSGGWSCHVGLVNTTAPEQRASFTVQVTERLTVTHFWEGSTMGVSGQVHDSTPVDYCRFVRIDGFGFTTENVPSGYELEASLHSGRCTLYIHHPSILDQHPWTVAVKITGEFGEISKSTMNTLLIHPPQNEGPEGPEGPGMPPGCGFSLWLLLIIFGLLLIGAGVALIPKKNRQRTYARASQLRNSFRKQPLPLDIVTSLPPKV